MYTKELDSFTKTLQLLAFLPKAFKRKLSSWSGLVDDAFFHVFAAAVRVELLQVLMKLDYVNKIIFHQLLREKK